MTAHTLAPTGPEGEDNAPSSFQAVLKQDEDIVLSSPKRSVPFRILELARKFPSISIPSLCRILHKSSATLSRHVRALERAGAITVDRHKKPFKVRIAQDE